LKLFRNNDVFPDYHLDVVANNAYLHQLSSAYAPHMTPSELVTFREGGKNELRLFDIYVAQVSRVGT
jgi:hypothetical protein